MTDEDAFQAALDAAPDDHVTRGAFGDWLCDRDDPRGPGYQAMARMGLYPGRSNMAQAEQFYGFTHVANSSDFAKRQPHAVLPRDWFWNIQESSNGNHWWDWWEKRRDCEGNAARGFARLAPERQAKLLTPQPIGAT